MKQKEIGLETMYHISVGITTYPMDGNTYAELLKHADDSLYQNKEKINCKNIYVGFHVDSMI